MLATTPRSSKDVRGQFWLDVAALAAGENGTSIAWDVATMIIAWKILAVSKRYTPIEKGHYGQCGSLYSPKCTRAEGPKTRLLGELRLPAAITHSKFDAPAEIIGVFQFFNGGHNSLIVYSGMRDSRVMMSWWCTLSLCSCADDAVTMLGVIITAECGVQSAVNFRTGDIVG